ncbi:hypothetical protein [Sphingomonas sp. RS2018]
MTDHAFCPASPRPRVPMTFVTFDPAARLNFLNIRVADGMTGTTLA